MLLAGNGEIVKRNQLRLSLQDSSQEQKHGTEMERESEGLFGRAFQQAKRLGEAIDPDTVSQVEQAWKVRDIYHQPHHEHFRAAICSL